MNEIKETGGARIGIANTTWPFATLTVNKNKLMLNATIIGNLVFKPSDIISIEPYTVIPILGQGIKINHCVDEYKSKVIFWTFGSPGALIKRIEQTGFLNNTDPISADIEAEILESKSKGSKGGFPFKPSSTVAILVIWNILFLMDYQKFFGGDNEGSPLGIGAQSALGFILLICILLLTAEPVRRLILKEGRTIQDIKKFIYFIMVICGFMFLIFTLLN